MLRTRIYSDTGRIAKAFLDIGESAERWRLWGTLGWLDILQRYRRAIIGPFWITLSMGALVGVLGFVYSSLFHVPTEKLIPYLASGLIVWNLISSVLIEGSSTFIRSDGFIKHGNIPISLYIFRLIWSNTIVFLHNLVIMVFIWFAYGEYPGWGLLLFAPMFLLVAAILLPSVLIIGVLCTRFRDLPPIVANVLQIAFFITPILYRPGMLPPGREFIAVYNPFYYLIEALRAPLLGEPVSAALVIILLCMWLVVTGTALLFFARTRARVAYWL